MNDLRRNPIVTNAQDVGDVEVIIDITEPPPLLGLIGDTYLLGTHRGVVVGPDHPIVSGLIDVEVAQLVALGDREDEARQWLERRDDTIWGVLLANDDPVELENVLGLYRFTMRRRGDRGLRDLAVLLQRHIDDVSSEFRGVTGLVSMLELADLTTLDLTVEGSRTMRGRVENLGRIVTIAGCAAIRAAHTDNIVVWAAMVNPMVNKFLGQVGVPKYELGYGVLEYKLTEKNATPMQTMPIWGSIAELSEAARSGSTVQTAAIGAALERSGFAVVLSTGQGQDLHDR